jgi:very-short-patch-repair endonuclease
MDDKPPLIHTRTTSELWKKIKPLTREMRKAPTPAEDALWQQLRRKARWGVRFRRQHPIDRFIVEFYCAEAGLVIEVDGEIHQYTQAEDALRTEFLESLGLRVIRFDNGDALTQIEGVVEAIGEVVEASPV